MLDWDIRVSAFGIAVLFHLVVVVLASFVASVAYFLFTGNDDHADILTVAIATVLVLVLSWVVLVQAASGSASIEHMMEDVSDALAWVHNPENNSILGLHAHKHAYAHKHMIDTDTDIQIQISMTM